MDTTGWSKRVLVIVGILIAVMLTLSLLWDSSNGWGGSDMFTTVGLLLVLGGMLYLWQMQNISERAVSQRIRADYPSELRPRVMEIYRHLKIKELDGLFLKILDDSKGDLEKVKKLASVAESVSWKAFLDNKW
jgi:hypothetical protein